MVSVLHGFLLHAVFLLTSLGSLTCQPSLVFPPVFFIPIFLLRILPLPHLFLDKDYTDGLGTLEGRISWFPHLSPYQFSVTLSKSLHFCLNLHISKN